MLGHKKNHFSIFYIDHFFNTRSWFFGAKIEKYSNIISVRNVDLFTNPQLTG